MGPDEQVRTKIIKEIQTVIPTSSRAGGDRPRGRAAHLFDRACPNCHSFLRQMAYSGTQKHGERGISHASLYSLRDHHFDCDRSWRLFWTPRKSRGLRAVEARLDDDDGIALLNYLSGKCQPWPGSSRPGFLCVSLPPGAS